MPSTGKSRRTRNTSENTKFLFSVGLLAIPLPSISHPPGPGGSGKTTLIKQMKIVHQGGFTDEELADYRPTVYKNVLDSAQAIVVYMRKVGMECVEYNNRVCADKILDYRLDGSPGTSMSNPYFSLDIANAIHEMWQDPIILKVMDEHLSEFYLMDSAA